LGFGAFTIFLRMSLTSSLTLKARDEVNFCRENHISIPKVLM